MTTHNALIFLENMLKESLEKRTNGLNMIVALRALGISRGKENENYLMNDMIFEISQYLFWDIRSKKYYEHCRQLYYKDAMNHITLTFHWCTSRNNNLPMTEQWFVKTKILEIEDDVIGDENANEFLMFAKNCFSCGNYLITHNFNINYTNRIFCHCINDNFYESISTNSDSTNSVYWDSDS